MKRELVFGLLLFLLPALSWALHEVPVRVVFESLEQPDLVKRVITFVRTGVREDNTPTTYEGGLAGVDVKRNPATGKLEELPFRTDEAGNGDCWATFRNGDNGGSRTLVQLRCDNDGYAEGGSTGVLVQLKEGCPKVYDITGYVQNRPNNGDNWRRNFGQAFRIKSIQWD